MHTNMYTYYVHSHIYRTLCFTYVLWIYIYIKSNYLIEFIALYNFLIVNVSIMKSYNACGHTCFIETWNLLEETIQSYQNIFPRKIENISYWVGNFFASLFWVDLIHKKYIAFYIITTTHKVKWMSVCMQKPMFTQVYSG